MPSDSVINQAAITFARDIIIFPATKHKGGLNAVLNAVLMRRQSCVEAYAEDAQAPASSFGSEKEGSLSKA